MSIRSNITDAQKEAMKNKDVLTLSVVRMVYAAIRNSEIDKGRELVDEEVITILRQQNKQQLDAIKDFESGARHDLVEKANLEIEVLKKFLPEELSDEEIKVVIETVLSQNSGSPAMGIVMGIVMKELKGRADGNRVRALLENRLKP
jgi:uncharacterized protein YqeY